MFGTPTEGPQRFANSHTLSQVLRSLQFQSHLDPWQQEMHKGLGGIDIRRVIVRPPGRLVQYKILALLHQPSYTMGHFYMGRK